MNSKNSKIKTNKYLNNDIAKLVPAVVAVMFSVTEMKAFRGKEAFPVFSSCPISKRIAV